MTVIDLALDGLLFACAAWVFYASVKRLNLMQWGQHQCGQLLAYIALAVWAFSYVLPPEQLALQLQREAGVVGVALLFVSGRKRWLEGPPEDVRRQPIGQTSEERT